MFLKLFTQGTRVRGGFIAQQVGEQYLVDPSVKVKIPEGGTERRLPRYTKVYTKEGAQVYGVNYIWHCVETVEGKLFLF